MRIVAESRGTKLVANGVMAMLMFIVIEAMFFAGLISAHEIVRATAMIWPPPGQPRLPLEATAVNTAALLISGALLFFARRRFRRDPARAATPLLLSICLGAFFVIFQGTEWVALLRDGLTLTSSTQGSFFYLIIGMHGLHAIAALGLLGYAWFRLRQGWLSSSLLGATEVFWYFVVGLWPILYWVVYR
jgi:heme/copper-type cytochrome/quinol oxidase subunit 3